jgi:cell filamentation protein
VSKYQYRQSDIYLPGTDLPINRLGIDNADLLHEIEARLLQQLIESGLTRSDTA